MIAITGANGQLGKTTIQFLLKKTKPQHLIALARDPQKLSDLQHTGIQIRTADYNDPASLYEAFRGAEKVLHISAISTGPEGRQQEDNVVRAARQQGVKHIVYTSALNAKENAHFFSAHQCLQTEKTILDTGLPYTFFRNSLYLETIPQFIGNALQDGSIYLSTGNGKVSFVSRPDIAEALSIVLTEDTHQNKRYDITGSQAFSFEELAKHLQTAKGVPVTYTDIPDEALREELAKIQMPAGEIDWFISLTQSIKANEFARVDNALEHLLGRQPVSLTEYLRNM